ncbi:hypothetical protein QTN25_008492 [Entamoeba marina]
MDIVSPPLVSSSSSSTSSFSNSHSSVKRSSRSSSHEDVKSTSSEKHNNNGGPLLVSDSTHHIQTSRRAPVRRNKASTQLARPKTNKQHILNEISLFLVDLWNDLFGECYLIQS